MKVYKSGKTLWKSVSLLIVVVFVSSLLISDLTRVKLTQATVLGLPEPTSILEVSDNFSFPVLKGLKLERQ